MLSSRIKDLKFRKNFLKNEKKKKISKFLFINLLSFFKRKATRINTALLFLQYKTKKSSKVRLVNRCVFTNRAKGINRFHSLSRIVLRDYMQFGIIPGYTKAAW